MDEPRDEGPSLELREHLATEVTLDEVLAYLNRLANADPVAIAKLLETRVDCNDTLAADPDCQVVLSWTPERRAFYKVGMLGVLSGIFGPNPPEAGSRAGWGRICAVFDVCCPCTRYYVDTMCSGFLLLDFTCDVTQEELGKLGEGKPCPKCGAPLVVGRLQGFKKTWDGEVVGG